jgi:hypothetical protein
MTTTTTRVRPLLLCALAAAAACGPESCCAPPATGATITDARVRACDLLVLVDGDEVPATTFSEKVRGAAIPKAPRLAVSFAAREDLPLDGQQPFTFAFTGTPGNVSLVDATCFDAQGAALDGTPLRLDAAAAP